MITKEKQNNVDIYVTRSNSKFLSLDIATEFRGRGDKSISFIICRVLVYNIILQMWELEIRF